MTHWHQNAYKIQIRYAKTKMYSVIREWLYWLVVEWFGVWDTWRSVLCYVTAVLINSMLFPFHILYTWFFRFICCVMCTTVCLFVFFIFCHGVVSLFSIYEFDCPSGIFRPSFIYKMHTLYSNAMIYVMTWPLVHQ